jgi:predicted PurR-regulated permease PerM
VSDTTRRLKSLRVPTADRAVLIGLAFLGVALLGSLIYPMAAALLFAAVLAGALYPQFEWLSLKLGGRAMLASLLLTIVVTASLTVPTVWLAVKMGDEALIGISAVERALKGGGGVPELVRLLPEAIRPQARRALNSVPGGAEQIEGLAENRSGHAANVVTVGVVATTKLVIDFSLMMVAFFLLLIDGKRLVHWVATVAPLPAEQILEILSDFRRVSVAVLLSSLGTAGVQSVAALVGYLATGVPQPLFFALVTFIVAFIPAVGATSVVVSAAGLLFFTNHAQAALYLALWGVFVVSTVDNLVKPWLLKGQVEIHGGLIFFALIGGLATFGPAGLVAGPLILSFFLATVRLNRIEPHKSAVESQA